MNVEPTKPTPVTTGIPHSATLLPGCPYFALAHDPQTTLLFPSSTARCHRTKPSTPIRLEYQRAYCLTADHTLCPIFSHDQAGAPPAAGSKGKPGRVNDFLGRVLMGVVLVALVALFMLWLRSLSGRVVESPAATTLSPGVAIAAVTITVPTGTASAGSRAIPPAIPSPQIMPTASAVPTTLAPLPTTTATNTPASTPTATSTPQPPTAVPPSVLVIVERLNVRTGPDTAYPVLALVTAGSHYDIIGRFTADSWWQVCCFDGVPGWVIATAVEIQGDVSHITVPTDIPPVPTATAEP